MFRTVLLLLCLSRAWAFPSIFVARYAKDCTDHPAADFGKVHDYQKALDKQVSFSLNGPTNGKPGRVCAGDSYSLQVDFGEPSKRNFLLTSTHGSLSGMKNDCDNWCENRLCSSEPATQVKATLKLPCDIAPGKQVTIKVTSANGRTPTPGSSLRSATLSLTVEGQCPGKCGAPSSSSSSSSSGSKDAGSSKDGGKDGGKKDGGSGKDAGGSSSKDSSSGGSSSKEAASGSSSSSSNNSGSNKGDHKITTEKGGGGGGGGGDGASNTKKAEQQKQGP